MTTPIVHLHTPTLPIQQHIALDRALMSAVGAGQLPPLVRLWDFPDEAIVVGIAQNPQDYVHLDACAADGLPVLRRFSGGGTVCLLRGCVVFSVIIPLGGPLTRYDVHGAYRYILSFAINHLQQLGLPANLQPPCDVAIQNRKIIGCAQAQKSNAVLVHGSVLVDAPVNRLERYLKHPKVAPAYRAGRSHTAFVQNLADYGFHPSEVAALLANAWAPERIAASLIPSFISSAVANAVSLVPRIS
ncbi:MAG: lipoate--protein ligase family protein [bacterium]|nr:lipoate--protein ligase family protein [bacterium]